MKPENRGSLTIFWPPGPLPFKNASVNSSSSIGFGRSGIFFTHAELDAAMSRLQIVLLKTFSLTVLAPIEGSKTRIIVHFVDQRFWLLERRAKDV
jgi:hypothetical protein